MSFSYKEFPQDVLDSFSPLIEKHNLSKKIRGDHFVELTGEKVVLQFAFDRGDLYCEIKKPSDNFKFAIWQVYEFLFPNSQIKIESKEYPKADLKFYCELLNKEMESIMLGDFSWYNRLRKETEYESSLISVILGPEMDYEHPISQKFWNGDKTWKSDIEDFIKQKGIKLK
ncbi:hypothetical protein KO566_13880 [Flavobacteriaceae bacterium XHP0103]|uniref:hypothetical protein n=1 Tax=Marixanthotalea marina TaxID=2844359 RepID=UPI002989B14F|nr:hypothetical protein [Marixanthotalea marina]MBU3823148.1 hypothetical protein [Marixanthotalea marina]